MVVGVIVITLLEGVQPGSGLSHVTPLFLANTTAFAAILSMVAIAPWAYVGFDNAPQVAGEFHFSSKSLIALVVWIALGVACYLANRKKLTSIPPENFNYRILGSKHIHPNYRPKQK
ncbi:hypothetical protein GCM10008983_11660 [Lentibacillus halophilus]|uniref:Uncharacterized protein n=1 Tax=Lentibacillus halophilus TaxID=295065 RepID=A0ABN0Z7G5_9BACI